jgi:putative FmdB family regulatory protein
VPIYDYLCGQCGHLTEVVHGINDPGPKFCPECGAEGKMTKAFAPPTIHFKGSGWAKKDRSSSTRSAAAKKDEAPASTGSGGEASSSATKGSTGDAGGAASGSTASDGSAAPASSGD